MCLLMQAAGCIKQLWLSHEQTLSAVGLRTQSPAVSGKVPCQTGESYEMSCDSSFVSSGSVAALPFKYASSSLPVGLTA